MASTPGFEPGPQWWEASALTTAPPLLPLIAFCIKPDLSLHLHIKECSRLLFYSKCSGFTVCFTYSDVSLSMYKINVKSTLNYLTCDMLLSFCFKNCFFSNFERFLSSSPFTVPNSRKTREESLFWKGSRTGAIFSPKLSHHPAFKLCSKKVERFTLLLLPSDRKSYDSRQTPL